MTMSLRFGLMALMALIMRVTAFQGYVGCYDELTVYVDGAAIPSGTEEYQVNISLASTPTVIAAKCVNKHIVGYIGLEGSFDDGVVTDTSWRCSAEESAGWTDVSFNDSVWASAVLSFYGPPKSSFDGVSTSARSIWNAMRNTDTIYCRKNLRPPTPFQGKIGCDDELTVYLDGTEVASDTVWNQVNDISLPSAPTVIAAKCVDTGGAAGIVGSFDGGLVTDTSWRCSDTEAAGWTEASFDDSAWASAVESTNAPSVSSFEGVSPSAKVIWTSAVNVGTVYCRLIL